MSFTGQDNLHDSTGNNNNNNSNKRRLIIQAPMPSQEDAELLQKEEEKEVEEGNAALIHIHLNHAGDLSDHNLNSSSDVSAAYFSGDSDLTAEQMGIVEEDGSKSSNSDSLPLPLPPGGAQLTAGTSQDSVQHQLHNDNSNVKDKEERQTPPTPASKSTSTAAIRNRIGFRESQLFSPPTVSQLMHERTTVSRPSSLPECADSGREQNWLELRLGFPSDQLVSPCAGVANEAIRERNSRDSTEEAPDSGLVTLQLLPEKPKVTEQGALMEMPKSPMHLSQISVGSSLCGSIPTPIPTLYHPSSAALSALMNRIGPRIEGNRHGFPVDQQFVMSQSNDPAAAFRQWRVPGSDTGFSYGQAQPYVVYGDRAFLDDRRSSEIMLPAPMARPSAALAPEIHRPSAAFGWPSGGGGDARWYSARPTETEQMSWEGLVRGSLTPGTASPYGEGLPDSASGRSFVEVGGGRRRNINMTAQSPTNNHPAANYHRLRLATSPAARRNAGLWFSLQATQAVDNGTDSEEISPMHKIYLRIRDGKMQISVLKNYLITKLGLSGEEEVEITCRGKPLAPTLTIQHVRDKIWLSKELEVGETIGFRSTNTYLFDSKDKIMALFYQRHAHTITLNLLKP